MPRPGGSTMESVKREPNRRLVEKCRDRCKVAFLPRELPSWVPVLSNHTEMRPEVWCVR